MGVRSAGLTVSSTNGFSMSQTLAGSISLPNGGLDFWVAPWGNDANSGLNMFVPKATLSKLAPMTISGDTIHLMAGTNLNEFNAPTNILMPYGVNIDADPGSWIALTNVNNLNPIKNTGFSPNLGCTYNNLGIIFYSPIANYGGAVWGYNNAWNTNVLVQGTLANPCIVNNLRLMCASGLHFEAGGTNMVIIFNNPYVVASSHCFLNKSAWATVYVNNPTFIQTNWFPQQQYGTAAATKQNYVVDASATSGGATYINGGSITYSDTALTNNVGCEAFESENSNQASNNVVVGTILVPSIITNALSYDIYALNGSSVTNALALYDVVRNDGLPLTESNSTAGYSLLSRWGSTHSGIYPWAMTTISFPNTTVNWTNTLNFPISLNIDNTGVTGTAIKKNGTQIKASPVPLSATLDLLPGDYFSETYTVGTPAAYY